MLYCTNCGAQNPDTAKFCVNCGATLEGEGSSLTRPETGIGSKTATTLARRRSPIFITHLGFWGSVMIVIGFFMDWLKLTSRNITGYSILSSAKEILNSTNNDKVFMYMLIALGVILLSAVICIFYTMTGLGRALFIFFKILPLLTIIAFVAYLIVKVQDNQGSLDIQVDSSVWDVIGVGIYLTMVGSFILAISRFRK